MAKINKTTVKVGNLSNANALRDIADKMEQGDIAAYSIVILENKGDRISVDMKAGVTEHDEGMYLALIKAMENQWTDCIGRKSEMIGPKLIMEN